MSNVSLTQASKILHIHEFSKKKKKQNKQKQKKKKPLLQCNAQKLIVYRTVQIVLSPPYTY